MGHRACDRCYKVKASCVYIDASVCTRCARLGHDCETLRPFRKAGRPRLESSAESASVTLSDATSPYSVQSASSPLLIAGPYTFPQNYQHHELQLIDFLLRPEQIASLLYGTTFNQGLLESMATQFFSADEKLKYGLLALASSMCKVKNIESLGAADDGHENSSKALILYSRSSTTSLEDAKITLSLALSLITYNDLSLGLPTLPIARSALLRIEPWKAELIGATTEATDPCVICILFVEMFECLLTGQQPVFRYNPIHGNEMIDRYYGISHELLPLFYDICQLYSSLDCATGIQISSSAEQILASVNSWQPEVVMEQRGLLLGHDEYLHCLRQARCFKLAAQLLISQTQRSSFNDILSKSLAMQLQQEIQQTIEEGKGRPKYLLFPYFLACIELENPTCEAHDSIELMMHEISNGMASQACRAMLACLQDIWNNRVKFPHLPWKQCISKNQVIAMGP